MEKLSARLSDEKFLQNAPVEVIGNDKKNNRSILIKTQLGVTLANVAKGMIMDINFENLLLLNMVPDYYHNSV